MNTAKFVIVSWLMIISFGAPLRAQDELSGSLTPLDRALKSGFAALSENKFSEARISFEKAMLINSKDTAASDWLFTKITLPDEGPIDMKDDLAVAITLTRRAMGTKQSILMFLAYTYQLEGNRAQADKYFDAVYALEGPAWGLSWRTFIPLVTSLYYASVGKEKTENYGRFLFLAGKLMASADEHDLALKMILEAQSLVPKAADIPAYLAGIYVMRGDAPNTRKFAQMSLDIDPKQNRVLIDYATGDWLAGDLASAVEHASTSIAIDNEMPGPYATLAMVALEKGDLAVARKNAEIGVKLSKGHAYYQSVLAAVLAAEGKSTEAKKLLSKAWEENLPDEARLKQWFFRGKPLELVLKMINSR